MKAGARSGGSVGDSVGGSGGGGRRREAGARTAAYRSYVALINTGAPRKLLHIWITLVIVEQYLVKNSRIDGPTEYR